jgi:hypothetical protein
VGVEYWLRFGIGMDQAFPCGITVPENRREASRLADSTGAFDGLAVGMEPVAPFLGLGIRHPNGLGGPSQASLADAHRTDFVIVGVRFFLCG